MRNFKFTTESWGQEQDLRDYYLQEFSEHKAVTIATENKLQQDFGKLCRVCIDSIVKGGKIMFFGNGGSASDSQHLATELTIRYKDDRQAIPALALTTDTSTLTATPNDFSFDVLFSRQIEALGSPEDVAIGISTSGNSENVIQGLMTAKKMGMVSAALSGNSGGRLHNIADPLLIVPSATTSRIQEMHITLGQMLCGAIEKGLSLVD